MNFIFISSVKFFFLAKGKRYAFFVGRAKALYELGPDYQSTFLATESDPAFEQSAEAAQTLIEGKQAVSPLLILSYNAQVYCKDSVSSINHTP